jgi:hypothetical protein
MTERLVAVPVPPQQRRSVPDARGLLAAADADADALADRLHDGALQALVVARYAADAAVRGGDPVLARDAVQEALVALRRAVWDLRPRGEDDLPAAVGELSSRRAASGSPALDLALDSAVAAALSPTARAVAFRFVQAATPSDGAVVVTLTAEAGSAVVTAGGTPEDLPGWQARAAALGGHLDTSGPCARLLLPLLDDSEGDR